MSKISLNAGKLEPNYRSQSTASDHNSTESARADQTAAVKHMLVKIIEK